MSRYINCRLYYNMSNNVILNYKSYAQKLELLKQFTL